MNIAFDNQRCFCFLVGAQSKGEPEHKFYYIQFNGISSITGPSCMEFIDVYLGTHFEEQCKDDDYLFVQDGLSVIGAKSLEHALRLHDIDIYLLSDAGSPTLKLLKLLKCIPDLKTKFAIVYKSGTADSPIYKYADAIIALSSQDACEMVDIENVRKINLYDCLDHEQRLVLNQQTANNIYQKFYIENQSKKEQTKKTFKIALCLTSSSPLSEVSQFILNNLKKMTCDVFTNISTDSLAEHGVADNVYYLTDLLTCCYDYDFVFVVFDSNEKSGVLIDICELCKPVIITDNYDAKLKALYYNATAILCVDAVYPEFKLDMPYSTLFKLSHTNDVSIVIQNVCESVGRLVSALPFTVSQRVHDNFISVLQSTSISRKEQINREQMIISDLICRILRMNVQLNHSCKLRIIYDLTPLSFMNKGGSSRAGIYLTILRILIVMLKNPNLDVYVYCKDVDRRRVEDNNLIDDVPDDLKFSLRHFTDIDLDFYEKVQYFDILFCPMNAAPMIFRNITSLKKFTLLYDTVPLLFPEWYPFAKKEESFVYEIATMANSDSHYIAISESTKNDYLSFSPNMKKENVFVAHLAASDIFYCVEDAPVIERVKRKYGIPAEKKYLFSLCTIEPRKNLLFAIECFLEFIAKNNIDDLVFVLGGEKWDSFAQQFDKKLGSIAAYSDKIIKIGYIDDSDLAPIFSGALFFVYPSFYEGFGLPVLEAMQCGCPVITSNVSSIPEVTCGAGILINHESSTEMIAAMEVMYSNEVLRKTHALKGLEMSKKFSWKKTVDNIVDAFHTAIGTTTKKVHPIHDKPTVFSKKPHTIFTIVSKNYLGQALTLHQSLQEHPNQNYNFIIFIMDMLLNEKEIQLIERLNTDGVNISFFSEVKTTIKNIDYEEMLFKYDIIEMNTAIKPYILQHLYNIGYEKVIYVDPDTYFYQPIDFLDKILDEYDIVLTPHMLEPYPNDGKGQVNITILQSGIYNCGFVGTRRSPISEKMLAFWQESLFSFCFIKPTEGLFTDQAWATWFPALYEKVCILRHRGHNAAYWNLHERKPYRRSGKWYMNDDELVFYHFSGFNPVDFYSISKYQNRFNLGNAGGDYKALVTEYAKNLLENKFLEYKEFKYYYNYYPSLDLKILSVDERRRYFMEIVRGRMINPFLDDKRTANLLLEYYHQVEKNEGLGHFGINLVGYFEEMHSVGHVARLFANMMFATGIPFSITDISSNKHDTLSEENSQLRPYYTESSHYNINILFVNADEVQRIMDKERHLYAGKYNIALWFWEFETGVEKYSDKFINLNEVLCGCDFSTNVFRKIAPPTGLVSKTLIPFYQDWGKLENPKTVRETYKINDSDKVFIFTFDFNSSYNRKNPESVLLAFEMALSGVANAKLIIKTTNCGQYQEAINRFDKKIKELGLSNNVIFIDEKLTRNQIMSLINASDCYISLHRGEGFGLGILEAMSLGKPVIASNYSGNTEFMNTTNSLLVDCELVDCNDTFAHYKDVEKWAEPNTETAAKYIKKIYDDKEFAKQLGRKAQTDVEQKYAKEEFMFSAYNLLKRAGKQ